MSFLTALRQRAEAKTAGLPALLIRAEKAATSVLTGEHAQRRAGLGEKFWQFREYSPTDRPQDIDWRQSAKGDRIFIRQKEWQTTQTALLWASRADSMDYRSDPGLPPKRDEAAVAALALAMLLRQSGERIGWLENPSATGRSDNAINALGQALITNAPESLPAPVPLPRNASVFVISDFLEPVGRIKSSLSWLAESAGPVFLIQTLDPAEMTLPFTGRVIFEGMGMDANTRQHINNVPSIRDEYQERLDRHLLDIQYYCEKQNWSYVIHRTDTDLRETLLALWSAVMEKPV